MYLSVSGPISSEHIPDPSNKINCNFDRCKNILQGIKRVKMITPFLLYQQLLILINVFSICVLEKLLSYTREYLGVNCKFMEADILENEKI